MRLVLQSRTRKNTGEAGEDFGFKEKARVEEREWGIGRVFVVGMSEECSGLRRESAPGAERRRRV